MFNFYSLERIERIAEYKDSEATKVVQEIFNVLIDFLNKILNYKPTMDSTQNFTADYYKDKYFVSKQDLINIQEAGEIMVTEIQDVFENFHQWLERSSEFKEYFTQESLEEIKASHWKHWSAFFQGNIDEEYISGRKESGKMYASIGLPLELYYSSLIAFYNYFEKAFVQLEINSFATISSFNKIANMDTAIAMNTYNTMVNRTIQDQNDALLEMSTPITQLWNGILLLPLVGIVDSKRAQNIMTTMLKKIIDSQSKAFILDISGIAMLDTAVANYLIKITKATQLMGCRCIISGISGPVAQTIVELGIPIEEVDTTGMMQDALDKALKITGARIMNLDMEEEYE